MWRLLKGILTSRIGYLLVAINLCLAIYDFAPKGVQGGSNGASCQTVAQWDTNIHLVAGRVVHYTYEAALYKFLALVNLPAVLLAEELFMPVVYRQFPNLCMYTASWVEAFILLTIASMQWLTVGFVIERVLRAESLK
jgi:hypothetical protein